MSKPKDIRASFFNFLTEVLNCRTKIVRGREGFVVIERDQIDGRSKVMIAAVQNFYEMLIALGIYLHQNPMKHWNKPVYSPRQANTMPVISGCTAVPQRRRLSDNFFIGSNNEWIPKTVDSPELPKLIMRGGELSGWGLREKIICRMLFETGGRVSEVLGFNLGDWIKNDCDNCASVFSKGSENARVKKLIWSLQTNDLLKEYFNQDRREKDKSKRSLSEYRDLHDENIFKLTPIFLNKYGKALSVGAFRSLYWNPACKAVKLTARIHQARHWFVTAFIRKIFEDNNVNDVLDDKIVSNTDALIGYMKWRGGRETLKSYNHFFMKEKISAIQANIYSSITSYEVTSTADSDSVGLLQKKLDNLRDNFNFRDEE